MEKYLFLFFVGVFLSSCSNESAVSPNYTPGWQPPVVSGIILMDEHGLRSGEFGSPDFPEDVMDENPPKGARPVTLLGMGFPYPNPADGLQSIRFFISRSSHVKVWVTPAQWGGVTSASNQSFSASNLIDVSGGKAIEVLADGSKEVDYGIHQIAWNASEVPAGFYRIYVQANGVKLWRDVYQCNRFEKNPYGIPEPYGCR